MSIFPRILTMRTLALVIYQKPLAIVATSKLLMTPESLAFNLLNYRLKSKKKQKKYQTTDSGTESEIKDEDFINDKHAKTLKITVHSLRLDAVVKAGLGISRNKSEVIFYENKVRLNGEKVPKKSTNVQVGDEIDIIKSVSLSNPDFLVVARIEVLSAAAQEENISMKIKRCKSLTIENYPDSNSWKGS